MKYLLLALFLSLPLLNYAQKDPDDEIKTIFDGDIDYGFFGGQELKFTSFNKDLGLMVGGRGGFVINHRLVLGGGGYGLTSNSTLDITADSQLKLGVGYGGVFIEYIAYHSQPVHVAVPVMIAGGAANLYRTDYFWQDKYFSKVENSSFFLIEPGVNAELNILKNFRIGLGLSYRYVAGVNMMSLSENDLRGVSFNTIFKFGLF